MKQEKRKIVVLHIYYHPNSMLHKMGDHHLEAPIRLQIIQEALRVASFPIDFIRARQATREEILKVHDPQLFDLLLSTQEFHQYAFTGDTIANSRTYEAALTAVGGSLQVAENLGTDHNFAMLRPPGHHATFDLAMGFCFFNNIAVATQYLVEKRIGKVAIIDIDNHHGNGTQEIFYAQHKVLYASLHADPRISFPGTGRLDEVGINAGEGKTVNIPLPYKTPDAPYLYAFESVIVPILQQFEPDAIMVSLGTDALYNDPYGALGLSIHGYYELGLRIGQLAQELCKNNIGVILEGGYKYDEMGKAVELFFQGMHGLQHNIRIQPEPNHEVQEIVFACKSVHRNYWYI